MNRLTIDGSLGEGGGQILRSALSLSLITGRPFKIDNIRKGRERPGLLRQHLASVQAAAQIGNAQVTGDELGSLSLSFTPEQIKAGDYSFSIGTAGSCTLLLQTILPALASVSEISTLTLKGGTHNPFAPPFDFVAKTFLPMLARLGTRVDASLIRPGFYPAGGGEIKVRIEPNAIGTGLEVLERGDFVSAKGRILFANLAFHIVERERKIMAKAMGWSEDEIQLEQRTDSTGPGNAVLIEIESANVTEVFVAFGERGRAAEKVAADACKQARNYLASTAVAGEYLADQLLLPIALKGTGRFTATRLSRHSTTNMEIIRLFLERSFRSEQKDRNLWQIEIG
ncbi:MAG: RNA 3'-terminal phosphate cyclase [Spirochaetia bacterium]|nr:RNA 3'-terminal phosphate cyclase [Spirochaetia bacterium]